ncbi:hypothetical protein PIB30_049120 [Stylosanthes scabra]|uniref:Uncharacterized protein n=1 Tax=Stylosanthes scabra TaxID=79078 RepID=A0ABU6VJ80_9FABA|nr:hypothetical protein [Stylosanthes scabra]
MPFTAHPHGLTATTITVSTTVLRRRHHLKDLRQSPSSSQLLFLFDSSTSVLERLGFSSSPVFTLIVAAANRGYVPPHRRLPVPTHPHNHLRTIGGGRESNGAGAADNGPTAALLPPGCSVM